MQAGNSAMLRSQRAREEALALSRQANEAHELARRFKVAAEGERKVATQLQSLTGNGWRLLVDRRWPGTNSANVDMILVGYSGVFVIDVKNWHNAPTVANNRLFAKGIDCDNEIRKLLAMTRTAYSTVEELGLSPIAVQPVMVFVNQDLNDHVGSVLTIGGEQLIHELIRRHRKLTPQQVNVLADHLGKAYPAYESANIAGNISTQPAVSMQPETSSLFDIEALQEAFLESALAKPIERWMTFLHQNQVSLVRRHFNGPARISGPAGTGKTVVGLHRAVHLARRNTGCILYVTFAKNLPRVQQQNCRRLAPAVADRIEFINIHAWAMRFLRSRGITTKVNSRAIETAFSKAWSRHGQYGVLSQLEPTPFYWRDEINCVIKGRGITTLADYALLERRGRRTILTRTHREAVWKLFEEYEKLRRNQGLDDFNDVLQLALDEVKKNQADLPYSAVIVDEVQDLTLVGAKLLHSLVGDTPNGLLLIGDGQQAVYPGGFRLSEAGISVKGARGQVLRVNYRNGEPILKTALNIVAKDPYDDIDDSTAISGVRDVEATILSGESQQVEFDTHQELDDRLIELLMTLSQQLLQDSEDTELSELANAAILCPSGRELDHYYRLLHCAGIPVLSLENYDGTPVNAVKLGTYRRSKGLEFKHVFMPDYTNGLQDIKPGAAATEQELIARRKLLVGISRARDSLWMASVRKPAINAGAIPHPRGHMHPDG